ncbi:MAG: PDZ domain-containing protein, partial [Planctomycetes bacterium]|nr:PDZ domain-containing protein [Planctomycetota bacterium]
DPAAGDFRVKEGSPALKLGFVNFPMDEFGVQKPELRAIARTPEMPGRTAPAADSDAKPAADRPRFVWQAQVRNIAGLGDRSAYGLPEASGVLLLSAAPDSLAAKAGLRKDDVVLACNGKPVKTVGDLLALRDEAAGGKLAVEIRRKQGLVTIEVADYAFALSEYQATPDFKAIPLAAPSAALAVKVMAGRPGTMNEPVSVLTDGKLARNYGPVFGNGIVDGAYKLDLGVVASIAQVNTFSHNQNLNRGLQRFVLYGSRAAADPGWNVEDRKAFTPIIDLDTPKDPETDFVATRVRQSGGRALGSYRWLVWAVAPATENAGGENTAFQEFQIIAAPAP